MIQNPKYDNDVVNLGYLNKRLETESQTNNDKISTIPKNYNSPPIPPYYENSLLVLDGKIYKCIKSRLQGSFNISDWEIAVDTKEIDEAIKFIFDVNKLEYVDQPDGLIETFYQEEDPSLNWTTDIEKGKHLSDLWTKDNLEQFQYVKLATNPVSYKWQKVSVPASLFDIVDGHKRIFLSQPTSYNQNDLWLGEATKIATKTATEFNDEDWVVRDDFIQSEKIEQEEYHKIYILPKITEINRYTVSEIKKSIDEIVLTVSQTYITQTDMEKYVDDVKTDIADTYPTKEEMNAQIAITSDEIASVVEKNNQQDSLIQEEFSKLTQTVNSVNIKVEEQQQLYDETTKQLATINGSLKNMEFDFSTKGMKVGTSTDSINLLLNNSGIKVYNYDKLTAIFNNRGSGVDKLIVTGSAQIGYLKFVKSTKDSKPVTKIFHLNKLIENLEDLEG